MKGTNQQHGTCLPCGKTWVQFPTCPFPPKLDYLIIISISLKMMYRPLTACARDDHTICLTHDSPLPLTRFKALGAPCQCFALPDFQMGRWSSRCLGSIVVLHALCSYVLCLSVCGYFSSSQRQNPSTTGLID